MLKHHQESTSAGEPTESQCDHSDISDPLPSAGGEIQYDNWTEQKQKDDSDSTYDRGWRVVELDHLANVGKKILVHLWWGIFPINSANTCMPVCHTLRNMSMD